jgi:hypothetical protein
MFSSPKSRLQHCIFFGAWSYLHTYRQLDRKGKTLYYVSVIIPSREKKEIIADRSTNFLDLDELADMYVSKV